jgi:hypothetical protein
MQGPLPGEFQQFHWLAYYFSASAEQLGRIAHRTVIALSVQLGPRSIPRYFHLEPRADV